MFLVSTWHLIFGSTFWVYPESRIDFTPVSTWLFIRYDSSFRYEIWFRLVLWVRSDFLILTWHFILNTFLVRPIEFWIRPNSRSDLSWFRPNFWFWLYFYLNLTFNFDMTFGSIWLLNPTWFSFLFDSWYRLELRIGLTFDFDFALISTWLFDLLPVFSTFDLIFNSTWLLIQTQHSISTWFLVRLEFWWTDIWFWITFCFDLTNSLTWLSIYNFWIKPDLWSDATLNSTISVNFD